MTVQQAWLDVPPRRRSAIPLRDLVAGIAMSVGICAVVLTIAASLEKEAPPPPEEELTVSIGVLASTDPRASGSAGAPGRAGKRGKQRGRKDATPTSATSEPLPTPPHHASSSASTLPPPTVPSPWDAPPGLPGLGDLGEPSDGAAEGGDETGGGEGGGGEGGGGEGNGGLGAYRSQLAAWLAGHFHVEGSGLGATALRKLRVRAVLELGEDLVVLDYRLTPTGTPAVDEAAKRALEAVKGKPLPTPPPSFGSQRRIHVVLTCRPDTCD